MGRHSRMIAPLLALACAGSTAWASKKAFNINDDLLAFPQFQVLFPDEYIPESLAEELLQTQTNSAETNQPPLSGQKATQVYTQGNSADASPDADTNPKLTYEEMLLDDRRFFCQIPRVETTDRNGTEGKDGSSSEADEKRELARATDRGMELLREMEGKCMYYVSGWWSYSFCYKKQVKQFHALPSGSGIPNYPPMEDPTTHSFILGRFPHDHDEDEDGEHEKKASASSSTSTTTDVAELQTKGGSRYLVQRLRGGTRCDLTGRDRKIEVQFHCHPQSTDRIGWIKELTTCSYLMVIYTPRLCNDVAFQPPQQDEVHSIECREILTPEQVPDWEAMREYHLAQQLVEAAEPSEYGFVGDIEVGAQRLVGGEGKEIEKGRVASAWEEKVDIVAKRENGEVQSLSRDELEKFDLDPKKIEDLRKRLEELAQGKDWTLEMVTANGERGLRGIVTQDEDEELEGEEGSAPQEDTAVPKTETALPGTKAASGPVPEGRGSDEDDDSQTAQTGDEQGSEETFFKDEL